MMRPLSLGLMAAVFLAIGAFSTSQSASAQGYGFGYYPGFSSLQYSHGPLRVGNIPTPPYFAIHPPVYYGQRVGMPYGNSPITRPPRAVVREVQQPQGFEPQPEGQWIVNPFVKKR